MLVMDCSLLHPLVLLHCLLVLNHQKVHQEADDEDVAPGAEEDEQDDLAVRQARALPREGVREAEHGDGVVGEE